MYGVRLKRRILWIGVGGRVWLALCMAAIMAGKRTEGLRERRRPLCNRSEGKPILKERLLRDFGVPSWHEERKRPCVACVSCK